MSCKDAGHDSMNYDCLPNSKSCWFALIACRLSSSAIAVFAFNFYHQPLMEDRHHWYYIISWLNSFQSLARVHLSTCLRMFGNDNWIPVLLIAASRLQIRPEARPFLLSILGFYFLIRHSPLPPPLRIFLSPFHTWLLTPA